MDLISRKGKELKTKTGEYMGGSGYGRTVGTSPLGGNSSSGAGIGTAIAMGGSLLLGALNKENGGNKNAANLNSPVLDKTFDNVDMPINNTQDVSKSWYELMKEEQAHREEREDTAILRAIEQYRKAGVNLNLLNNITPAESSGADFTAMQTASNEAIAQYQGDLDLLKTYIEQDFKGDENTKDRILGLIDSIAKIYIGYKIAGKK